MHEAGRTQVASRDQDPAPGDGLAPETDGNMLELGLAGHGIGCRRSQWSGARIRREMPAPVHGEEGLTRLLRIGHPDFCARAAVAAGYPGEVALRETVARGIRRIDLDRGLGRVGGQPGHAAGPRHRMPVVAQAARVERDRVFGLDRFGDAGLPHGDEARAPVGGREAVVFRKAPARRSGLPRRPAARIQIVIAGVRYIGQGADVEQPRALVLEGRQRGMLAEDRGRPVIVEGRAEAHTAGDVADDAPVRLRHARRRHESALA